MYRNMKKNETCPANHVSSSSSLSASSSKPPYRPGGTAFQSPLGRGRKLSLQARFALRATTCGFLDVEVPSPEPALRVPYDLEASCTEPTLAACGRGCLEDGRPIPSSACCLGIVADTARGACTGMTEARTGTGMAILLGGWPAPALGPLTERGTNLGPWGTLVSASRGRLFGTD